MASIEIDKDFYHTSHQLDAFQKLEVARKISPALYLLDRLIDPDNADKNTDVLFVLAFSKIPDADVQTLLNLCLSVVMRKQGEASYPIRNAKTGMLMYDDISLPTLLKLTMMVIEENLGDFFRTSLKSLEAQTETK